MQLALAVALAALPLTFACESDRADSSIASREPPPSPNPTPRFVAPAFVDTAPAATPSAQTGSVAAPAPAPTPSAQSAPPDAPLPTPVVGIASAQKPPDVTLFYDSLAPYGEWLQLAPYGWVWIPREVPVGWKPYTTGHWVYADQAGWVWVGDEPWAWAPYHYGRWSCDSTVGWVWVPGDVWAPAWVAWRTGPEYCGWAPLPPAAAFEEGVGVQTHGFDIDESVGTFGWCFVGTADVCAPQVHDVMVVPAHNVTMLKQTTLVNNITVENGRVLNRGVGVAEVEARRGRPVERVTIGDVDRIEPNGTLPVSARGANEIPMYRPTLRPAPLGARPKAIAAEAALNAQDDQQYAAFRQRENEQLAKLHSEEEARLKELHERDVSQATDENAIRDLREQHAAEVQAMQSSQQ